MCCFICILIQLFEEALPQRNRPCPDSTQVPIKAGHDRQTFVFMLHFVLHNLYSFMLVKRNHPKYNHLGLVFFSSTSVALTYPKLYSLIPIYIQKNFTEALVHIICLIYVLTKSDIQNLLTVIYKQFFLILNLA